MRHMYLTLLSDLADDLATSLKAKTDLRKFYVQSCCAF